MVNTRECVKRERRGNKMMDTREREKKREKRERL